MPQPTPPSGGNPGPLKPKYPPPPPPTPAAEELPNFPEEHDTLQEEIA